MAAAAVVPGRVSRSDTAMTGEISLRGLVLPVGGIKEKVVAAAAAGIKRVMLPARNKRDYDDIPEEVRKALEFVWLEKVDDAVAAGLPPGRAPGPPRAVVIPREERGPFCCLQRPSAPRLGGATARRRRFSGRAARLR